MIIFLNEEVKFVENVSRRSTKDGCKLSPEAATRSDIVFIWSANLNFIREESENFGN